MKSKLTAYSILKDSIGYKTLTLLFASSLAITILSFSVPLTVLQAYDRIIAYRSMATLTWLTLGALIALIFNALLEYLRGLLGAWTSVKFVRQIDQKLIEQMLDSDPFLIKEQGEEVHLERFRSLTVAANTIISRALPGLAEAPFGMIYIFVLLYIGRSAAVPALFATLVQGLMIPMVNPRIKNASEVVEGAEKKRVSFFSYALDRIHFIKAQALEHLIQRDFVSIQNEELKAQNHAMTLHRKISEMDKFLVSFTLFGTILWGGALVAQGALTIGAVSACLFFSTRLVGIAGGVRQNIFSFTEAQTALEEIGKGLEFPHRKNVHEPPLPRDFSGRLEFHEVHCWGAPGIKAGVENLSFLIRPGIRAALKTEFGDTFDREAAGLICRLAAGLIVPDKGMVMIDSFPSNRWNFCDNNGNIAYVSFFSQVLPGTILDNLDNFDPAMMDNALEVAQLFELDSSISRLPRGFETQISPKNSGGLSASALRLITIARVLAKRPRVLIWNRADIGLDKEARQLVLSILENLGGATTLLIHSSNPEFVNLATMLIDIKGHTK